MTTAAGNPYSPPKADVQHAARTRLLAERPKQVVQATVLLWIVLVLSLVSTGLDFRQTPVSWPAMIGTFAFGLALSLVRIVGIWHGRGWARVASVIIAALTIIAFPDGLARQPMVANILDVLTISFELMVLFRVFGKSGSLWFKYTAAQQA